VPAPDPIHDAVTQGQGFAYLTYALNPTTRLSLISGMTLSFNQFPNQPYQLPQYQLDHVDPALYPSSAINSGLNQQDYYGMMALNGALVSKTDYQLAYTAHYNTQTFYPDPIGDLIYQGISSNVFTSDLSNTLQGDLTYRPGRSHTLRGGFYLGEYGVESDQTSQVFPIVMGEPAIIPASRMVEPEQDQPALWCLFAGRMGNHRQAERKSRFALGSCDRAYHEQPIQPLDQLRL
jgi:hypothetical protein